MTRASDISATYVAELRAKGYGWASIAKMTGAAQSDLQEVFGGLKEAGPDRGRVDGVGLRAKPGGYVPRFPLRVPFTPEDEVPAAKIAVPVAKAAVAKPKRLPPKVARVRLTPEAVAGLNARLDRDYSRLRVGVWADALKVTAAQATILETLFVLAGEVVPAKILYERSRGAPSAGRDKAWISRMMRSQVSRLRQQLLAWRAGAGPVNVRGEGWRLSEDAATALDALSAPVIRRALARHGRRAA